MTTPTGNNPQPIPSLSLGKHTMIFGTTRASKTNLYSADYDLKINPDELEEVRTGSKTHEVRVFEQDYKAGDKLKLSAFDVATGTYTGKAVVVKVTYITAPGTCGLPENVGVLSFAQMYWTDARH